MKITHNDQIDRYWHTYTFGHGRANPRFDYYNDQYTYCGQTDSDRIGRPNCSKDLIVSLKWDREQVY